MPFLKSDDYQLFYEDHGSGTPILFLHPPGMGRKVFKYQEFLQDRFRVIFPDLSGHGDSLSITRPATIPKYAEEVRSLIDELGLERVVLCGYSSGGCIAQEFALRFPDRTIALILSGGFAEVESATLKYEHLLGMLFVKQSQKFLSKVIATAHTFDRSFRRELIDHMLKADEETWFQFYNESLHYSCVDRLKTLKVPLLLIYGSRDFINQHLTAYKKAVRQYQVAMIDHVSHQVPVKTFKSFNQVITDFLNGISD